MRSPRTRNFQMKSRIEMHYLTPKDLAQRYQISERQVTHLARIGYLPGFKVGKLWRFNEEDLQECETRRRAQRDREEINQRVDQIIKEVDKSASI
ncbi:MAG: helix-turn-helix domain-containing protein [bacterium]